MTERLTTLTDVKAWLTVETEASDTQLLRLIDAASQFTLNFLNRDSLAVREWIENFKGNGKSESLLRNWPIVAVSQVGIAGQAIVPSIMGAVGQPGSGYVIGDPRGAQQSINLYGYWFHWGSACQIIYTAGFQTEQSTVIASSMVGEPPVDIITPFYPTAGGLWIGNVGVTIDGTVASLADSLPIPAGQYLVDELGVYSFSMADVGLTANITYSYCPFDLSQGVTELIGEWYKRKDRIGLLSKMLGGQETVTFSTQDMNSTVRQSFTPYKNVVPV